MTDPERSWLGSRSFWMVCAGLVVVLASAALFELSRFARGDPGALAAIGFEGPSEVTAGDKLGYRVHVHDQRTGAPISRELVRLTLGIGNAERTLSEGRTDAGGQVLLEAPMPPNLPQGRLRLYASIPGGEKDAVASRSLRVRSGGDTLVSTDKPLYRPGETVHIRALSLGSNERPLPNAKAELEIIDPLTTKLHQASFKTSEFGIVSTDFVLADLVKLGSYRIRLRVGKSVAEREFSVEAFTPAQKTPRKTTPAGAEFELHAIAESGEIIAGIENRIWVVTADASGSPRRARVRALPDGAPVETSERGVARISLDPQAGSQPIEIEAIDPGGRRAVQSMAAPHTGLLIRPESAVIRAGTPIRVRVLGDRKLDGELLVGLSKDHRFLRIARALLHDGSADVSLEVPGKVKGLIRADAVRFLPGGRVVQGQRELFLESDAVELSARLDRPVHAPGQVAVVDLDVRAPGADTNRAALGLSVVEAGVFDLLDMRPDRERTFFGAQRELDDDEPGARTPFGRNAAEILYSNAPESRDEKEVVLSALSKIEASDSVRDWDPQRSRAHIGNAQSRLGRWLALAVIGAGCLLLVWLLVWVVRRALASREVVTPVATFPGFSRAIWLGPAAILLIAIGFGLLLWAAREDRKQKPLNAEPALLDSEPEKTAQATARASASFPETLLWTPELVTDDAGHARVEVALPDALTDWRMSISAIVPDGRLGSLTLPIRVSRDFSLDFSPPGMMTEGDEASIPVSVSNSLDKPQSVMVDLESQGLERIGQREQKITLEARETRELGFRFRAHKTGNHRLVAHARNSSSFDSVERKIRVDPDGAPVTSTLNARLRESSDIEIEIPKNAVKGATELSIKIYPGTFAELAESLEGVREGPQASFEQASSAVYPNVLMLDFLKRTGGVTSPIEKKANASIAQGYQRLLAFQVEGGGFDWFGAGPANTLMSAYALVELSEMSKLFPVDENAVSKTRDFLYSQQAPDGSWPSDDRLLTTAYVAWSIAQIGGGRDPRLQKALDFVAQAAGSEADDAYALALRANALLAGGRKDAARPLLTKLVGLAQKNKNGASWSSERKGVTFSRGKSLSVELTGLAAHALAGARMEPELRESALRWLSSERQATGAWASGSATVAALLASLDSVKRVDADDQTVRVTINDKPAAKVVISRGARDVHRLVDLSSFAEPGRNRIKLETSGAEVGFQLVEKHYVRWSDRPAEKNAPLELAIQYRPASAKVGQIVECRSELRWHRTSTLEMPIVEVGVPPGFEVETGDLEKLVRDGKIQRYAQAPDRVTFYLASVSERDPIRLVFGLRALHALRAVAPRSLAYAYYEPELRIESPPVRISVD